MLCLSAPGTAHRCSKPALSSIWPASPTLTAHYTSTCPGCQVFCNSVHSLHLHTLYSALCTLCTLHLLHLPWLPSVLQLCTLTTPAHSVLCTLHTLYTTPAPPALVAKCSATLYRAGQSRSLNVEKCRWRSQP